MTKKITAFDVLEKCDQSVQADELIESVSAKAKEFHFQNWFHMRPQSLAMHFNGSSHNTYPGFCLVRSTKRATRSQGYNLFDALRQVFQGNPPEQVQAE